MREEDLPGSLNFIKTCESPGPPMQAGQVTSRARMGHKRKAGSSLLSDPDSSLPALTTSLDSSSSSCSCFVLQPSPCPCSRSQETPHYHLGAPSEPCPLPEEQGQGRERIKSHPSPLGPHGVRNKWNETQDGSFKSRGCR